MPTQDSQHQLPPRPNLDHLKYQARDLLKAFEQGNSDSEERFRRHVPRFRVPSEHVRALEPTLVEAQLVVAREYGFSSWSRLKSHVDAVTGAVSPAHTVEDLARYFVAILDRGIDVVRECLELHPELVDARILDEHSQLRGAALHEALRQQPPPLPDLEHSTTALHLISVAYRDPEACLQICRLLVDHGADVNALGFEENNGHCTPIALATWEGGVEIMRLLLEHGADVSGDLGTFALDTAANHANTDRFDLLVEYGAQSTPWMLVRAGLTDRVVERVDEDPGLLNQRDEQGYSLLQAAALRMDRDAGEGLPGAGRAIAEALIERGVEVDVFTATALNDEDRLGALLQTDPALVHERLGDGKTPVMLAVLAGSNATLSVLLLAGADPSNTLYRAARMDDTDACKLLVEHGAEVTDQAVLAATWRNRVPACLELMLANGGNANAVDGRGTLHWVAAGNPESVQLLIDAGADVNMRAPGATNNTPLHHAAANAESTTRLLAAGADPTLGNANGDTPLDLAKEIEAHEVVDLLREAMDDWHLK